MIPSDSRSQNCLIKLSSGGVALVACMCSVWLTWDVELFSSAALQTGPDRTQPKQVWIAVGLLCPCITFPLANCNNINDQSINSLIHSLIH